MQTGELFVVPVQPEGRTLQKVKRMCLVERVSQKVKIEHPEWRRIGTTNNSDRTAEEPLISGNG